MGHRFPATQRHATQGVSSGNMSRLLPLPQQAVGSARPACQAAAGFGLKSGFLDFRVRKKYRSWMEKPSFKSQGQSVAKAGSTQVALLFL